jgi:hypothetical protein
MNDEDLPQIFISYATPDVGPSTAIAYLFRDAGFRVWFDRESLLAGEDWRYEIRHAISRSDLFLTLLSTKSIDRKGFYHKEMLYAIEEADKLPEGAVFIMPVRLDQCEVPERLNKWHAIDLFHADSASLLFRSISHALGVGVRCSRAAIYNLDLALQQYNRKENDA